MVTSRVLARMAVPGLAVLALLGNGCGLSSGMPEGSEFIPADSAFVLSLNLPVLASTDLYKELQEKGGAVGLNRLNFMQFARATGLDPARDVRWVTFLGRGQGEDGPQVDQLSALVSGTFDGKKVYDFLKDSGLPFETHAGLDIFQVVIVDGRCRLCIAVLDDDTATFGDGETLRAMGEARQDPSTALASDETAGRLLARLDLRAAIWGLARGQELAGSFAGFLQQMSQQDSELTVINSIQDVGFFVAAGDTILLAADAVTLSEEDALMVADILKGAGAMGKMALKQTGSDATRFLTSFKVQVDGVVVRASTSFPQADLVELSQGVMSDMFRLPHMPSFGLGGGDKSLIPPSESDSGSEAGSGD